MYEVFDYKTCRIFATFSNERRAKRWIARQHPSVQRWLDYALTGEGYL